MNFDSEFFINFDGSLEDLWLLGELDNPITVATLSSLRETKEGNEKHNLRSFEKADKDDVEKYLYSDQDKFFVKLVLIKKIRIFLPMTQFRRVTLYCSTGEQGWREPNTSLNWLNSNLQMNTLSLMKKRSVHRCHGCCFFISGYRLVHHRWVQKTKFEGRKLRFASLIAAVCRIEKWWNNRFPTIWLYSAP